MRIARQTTAASAENAVTVTFLVVSRGERGGETKRAGSDGVEPRHRLERKKKTGHPSARSVFVDDDEMGKHDFVPPPRPFPMHTAPVCACARQGLILFLAGAADSIRQEASIRSDENRARKREKSSSPGVFVESAFRGMKRDNENAWEYIRK